MINKLRHLKNSQLAKDALIYGITNALFTGLPIILMPFLISVLKPNDYGIIELFRSITMVLVPIIGLSTVQSITRYYYDLEENEFITFTSSIIILQIVNAIIALIVIMIISYFIEKSYVILLILAVIYYLFNQLTEALLSIYRVKKLSKNYLLIRLGTVVLDVFLLGILFLSLSKYDWTYRIIPNVLSAVIFGVVSLIVLWKRFNVKFQFDKNLLKVAILFSAPLILHMLSGYILNVGDRFFITYFLGTAELGNYSVAYQIGLVVSFFFTSFNLAWTPTFFEWMKLGKYNAIKKVKLFVFVALPILGAISIFGWIIISKLIPNLSKYNVDTQLVIIITIAYVILSYYKFNSNYYFYYKQTKILSLITFVTGIICVILYVILIPLYAGLGAAIATLITFVIMFVSTFIFKPNEENLKKVKL